MPDINSEDQSVQKPALEILESLGWQILDAMPEWNTSTAITTKRESIDEVLLKEKLRKSLKTLNTDANDGQLDQVMEILSRDRTAMSLVEANKQIYEYLKFGINVDTQNEHGERVSKTLKIIDWVEVENNDFLAVEEFTVLGGLYKRRADVVLFVNGIPLVNIEFKAGQVSSKKAFTDNITSYMSDIPQLYWFNAITVASNGPKARFGTITSGWEHYLEWKRADNGDEEPRAETETLIKGMFKPERLLDIIENFILYQSTEGGTIKIAARNHQYHGVNDTIAALLKGADNKLGVFWHTQGSGKSLSMVFFAQKVMRKIPGNWSFIVVTDRLDLDSQIYGNFATTGVVTEDEKEVRASSITRLRDLLVEDHRYVFTLIHKFQTEGGEVMPVLSERDDVIVMTDEAHRSQYSQLALNMRTALPNARYLGFTGTPLIGEELEITKEVFGDYVSVYDFGQAIADKATVPLYYENRIPKLELTNENFSEEMEQIVEEAELDEEEQDLLERKFAQAYHLITDKERLNEVAKDIVEHFVSRGYRGKAYYVGVDKRAAVEMYDLVQEYWQAKIRQLEAIRDKSEGESVHRLTETIDYMQSTDMAVIVSQSQNEIERLKKFGLDIEQHRKRMNDEDLEKKFKISDDPLRIVFVCSMWITGFDAPSVSTVYLDKPMRNHTLMQTIARANRVFKNKPSGTIVDYIGVFRSLRRALSIYGSADGSSAYPVRSKDDLFEELKTSIDELNNFCNELGFDLYQLLETPTENFERASKLSDSIELILGSKDSKSEFTRRGTNMQQQFSALLPDVRANNFVGVNHVVSALLRGVRGEAQDTDIDEVLEQVSELVDKSVAPTYEEIQGSEAVDLSKLDFEGLRQQFDEGRQRAAIEETLVQLESKANEMILKNRTRGHYKDKLENLINDYNSGAHSLEEIMQTLEQLHAELSEEGKRHFNEGLSEEELAALDMLSQNTMDKDKEKLKSTARELMAKLKSALVLDWRKSQRNRAVVKKTIRDELKEIQVEDSELLDVLYEHVYESYQDAENSVYSVSAVDK